LIDQGHLLDVKAISSSESLVSFYETTQRNIPEDSHLHIIAYHMKGEVISAVYTVATDLCGQFAGKQISHGYNASDMF
jgi:hypothetical protein